MKIFFTILLLFAGAASPLFAQEVYRAHTHLRLISEQNAVFPGKVFWVGVDFKLDKGWHVYWKNPGDSGMPPKLTWIVPLDITVGDTHWPYPKTINVGPLTSYGYDDGLLLLVPMTVGNDSQNKTDVHLGLHVGWLACREECDPGEGQLHVSLPIFKNPAAISFNDNKEIFDKTRLRWPQTWPALAPQAYLDGNQWYINITTPSRKPVDITFFPLRDDVIEHGALGQTQLTTRGYQLRLTKSGHYPGFLTLIEGIAVNPLGWDNEGRVKAVMIQAGVESLLPRIPFVVACVFAFVGGLILNLMPCVLPVLSIKVLQLLDRHPNRNLALRHALMYTLGVMVSVWSLSILLFVLKSAGQWAGWGFQFQSPVFVLIIAAILFMLALNLFDVYEISFPLISSFSIKEGYQASFLSGVLTTVVASPCTAPFMGTALTVAISQPNVVGLAIFTFLALGLASPFVLLSAFPALLSFVPKPGPWMVHLKKVLGVMLLVSVVWLLWIFVVQTGLGEPLTKFHQSSIGINWQRYSASAVEQAQRANHGVFIDFTAGWCINCQVNDRLVFQNPSVVKAFKDHGVFAFKADWTKYDPSITMALSSLGRHSIPVYVYYSPGSRTPIFLPQIMTPKRVVDLLNWKK